VADSCEDCAFEFLAEAVQTFPNGGDEFEILVGEDEESYERWLSGKSLLCLCLVAETRRVRVCDKNAVFGANQPFQSALMPYQDVGTEEQAAPAL
jgi:hypothetical protein